MTYDIQKLLATHRECLLDIASYFESFFQSVDYSLKQQKIKRHTIKSHADLTKILRGPGFYLIATDFPATPNPCTASVGSDVRVVYRGHSYGVRERIESHLFYETYRAKDSGRRFTVCMKLGGRNINIDRHPLSKKKWVVVTHSMPTSTSLIREAAEAAFDTVFGRPVGSDR